MIFAAGESVARNGRLTMSDITRRNNCILTRNALRPYCAGDTQLPRRTGCEWTAGMKVKLRLSISRRITQIVSSELFNSPSPPSSPPSSLQYAFRRTRESRHGIRGLCPSPGSLYASGKIRAPHIIQIYRLNVMNTRCSRIYIFHGTPGLVGITEIPAALPPSPIPVPLPLRQLVSR